jgi:hypothetical protein
MSEIRRRVLVNRAQGHNGAKVASEDLQPDREPAARAGMSMDVM